MAVVSWRLAVSAVIDLPTALLTVISIFLVFRYKMNSAWLVLGGGIAGHLITTLLH